MSLTFKDNQIAVISPGSATTLIQCGISESLLLPASYIPTRVYAKGGSGESNDTKYTFEKTDQEVFPLSNGAVTNERAFHYFIRQTYKTITQEMGIAPALLVLKSPQWNKRQLERLTQHLFEHAGVPALMFLSTPLASAFALALNDCIVVDVGLNKTDVTIVHEFEAPAHLTHTVNSGGSRITKYLQNSFSLTEQQAEDLKLSGIVEVPTGAREGKFDVESEEGVVDVAAIVSSGRTREFIEQREREQTADAETPKANIDLDENSFVDSNGQSHTIGRARFSACDDLIDEISGVFGMLMARVLPRLQANLWQNIIVTGKGALVPGFRQGLIAQLERVYLNVSPPLGAPAMSFGPPDTSTKQTPNEGDAPSQCPTTIKLAHIAEHFPEWKNDGWAQSGFLGAQIAAKQSFSSQASYYVSRSDYNEIGPQSVWDL